MSLPISLPFSASLGWYLVNALHNNSDTAKLTLPFGVQLSMRCFISSVGPPDATHQAHGIAIMESALEAFQKYGTIALDIRQQGQSIAELIIALDRDVKADFDDLRAVHLVEVFDGEYTTHFSRTAGSRDLVGQGISMVVDANDILSPVTRSFYILLSPDRLELLVSPSAFDLETTEVQRQPFGRALLSKFLQDVSGSADIHYAEAPKATALDSVAAPLSSSSSVTSISDLVQQFDPPKPPVSAHRAIMQHWPVFSSPLQRSSEKDLVVQELDGIDLEALRLVINFIYLGRVEGPGYTGIVDWRRVYQLACQFQVDKLAQFALERMCEGLKCTSALPSLFQWAYQHPVLEERLLGIVKKHWAQICRPSIQMALKPYEGHSQYLRIHDKLVRMALEGEVKQRMR
ncbi:hypothetical protein EDD11_003058 [Mortierella claussenii]|nr:hypothetical protein EDD11_003058 [Mortierella claussenii]